MLKRLLSCAAAFCLAASLIPATALAFASETPSDDGTALIASETGTCTVTFDAKGGTIAGSSTKTDTVSNGDLVDASAIPTKSGYRFAGWYANPSFEGMPWYNVLNSYQGEPVTGNMTLYAKWVEDKFVPSRDGFNFRNTSTDFFGDGGSGTYRISGDYFSLLRNQVASTIWGDVVDEMNETWGGSCFGMCAAVALLYAGKITPDFLQTDATSTHDIAKPSQSDVVKNAVNYYYLAQMIGDLGRGRATETTNETTNNRNLVNALNNRGDSSPVIVGLDIRSATRSMGGHAVLAYDIEDTGLNYEIDIWDPSYPSGLDSDDGLGRVNKLTISKDCTSSKFNAAYDNDTNGYHSFIKYAIPVSSYSSDSNSVQSLISQMARTNGTPYISRTVQLASREADEPMLEITVIDCESIDILGMGGSDETPFPGDFDVEIRDGVCTSHKNCNPTVEFVNEVDAPSKMRITIPCSELQGVYGFEVVSYSGYSSDSTLPEPDDEGDLDLTPEGPVTPDVDLPEITCRIKNAGINRFVHVNANEAGRLVLGGWMPDIDAAQYPPYVKVASASNGSAYAMVGVEDPIALEQGIDRVFVKSFYTQSSYAYVPCGLTLVMDSTPGNLMTVNSNPGAWSDEDPLIRRNLWIHIGGDSNDPSVPVIDYSCEGENLSYEEAQVLGASLKMLSNEDIAAAQPVAATLSANTRTLQQAQTRSVSYDAIGLFNAAGEMERSVSNDKSLSFYSLGGTPITQRSGIGAGYIVGSVQSPSREGFIFDGWFTTPNCSADSAWNAAANPIDNDTVLYAKWSRDPSYAHRVTLKDNDTETVYLMKDRESITSPPASSASSHLWSKTLTTITRDIVAEPSEAGPDDAPPIPYTVTAGSNVTCSHSSGVYQGTKVTVNAAKDGMYVKAINVKRTDNNTAVFVSTAQSDGSYVFIMPASNVSVTAEFTSTNPNIIVNPITVGELVGGGTVSVEVEGQMETTSAPQGAKVTLRAEPSEGGKLKNLTATAGGKSLFLHRTAENTYMFTMPATAVSIGGTFLTAEQAVKHTITVPVDADEIHGSFAVNPSKAREGDTVKITFQPALGYEIDFDSLQVIREDTNADISYTLSSDSTFLTFTMPACNVNMEGSFREKTYTLGLIAIPFAGGTVKMYRELEDGSINELTGSAAANTVVRLVPQAAAGYTLSSLSYKPTGAAETTITADSNGVYRFTMPPADIVITARFEMEIDTSKPHLRFTDVDDEPVGALTLTVGDTRSLGYTVVRPEASAEISTVEQQQLFAANDVFFGPVEDPNLGHGIYADTRIVTSAVEEDGDKEETAVTVQVTSDNEDVAEVAVIDDEETGTSFIRITTKQAGTAQLLITSTNDATVQPGTLTLAVRPFKVDADSASTSVLFDSDPANAGKTGLTLNTSTAVATYKDSEADHFRMDTVGDAAAQTAEGIIKGVKAADESIVHLVDLSLRNAKGEVVSANGFARKVTFKMTDEMKRHKQLGHTLFVAYVDPSGTTLERFNDVEYDDLTNPTSLSFETTHFSTYVVMAKGVGTEYAVLLHQSDGGDIVTTRTSAAQGETVKITAAPHIGYKLKGLSAMTAANDPVTSFAVTGNEGTFTMPASDVHIYADFEKEGVVTTTPTPDDKPTNPTPKPTTVTPEWDPEAAAGGPIYGDGSAGDGGAGAGSNGQTTSTAYITGANRGTTSTAGASTAGGSTSLVKTGDRFAAATICTSIMLSLIFGGIAITLRRRSRRP